VAGESLQHRDVDRAERLLAATAELAGLDAEVFGDAGAPLVGECLSVDEHQRAGRVAGDDRAGDDGLAGA
jgi:hypothetical protein